MCASVRSLRPENRSLITANILIPCKAIFNHVVSINVVVLKVYTSWMQICEMYLRKLTASRGQRCTIFNQSGKGMVALYMASIKATSYCNIKALLWRLFKIRNYLVNNTQMASQIQYVKPVILVYHCPRQNNILRTVQDIVVDERLKPFLLTGHWRTLALAVN